MLKNLLSMNVSSFHSIFKHNLMIQPPNKICTTLLARIEDQDMTRQKHTNLQVTRQVTFFPLRAT